MRAAIVEDEPEAARLLVDLLRDVDGMKLVGCAGDGEAAVELIDHLRPDLLFLDVHLPGPSGIEVLQRTTHEPRVVFTTAYDRYAIAALQIGALDFLVKPFGAQRFAEAIERVRRRMAEASDAPLHDRLAGFTGTGALSRIFVRQGERIVPVRLDEVRRIDAADDYVRLHTHERSWLAHIALGELARRLDPTRFLRIHRSHVINLDHVTGIVAGDERRLTVILDDGSRMTASRSGSQALRSLVL